ncbi:hypothetical protein RRG08_024971 [Elysia crispata]|uniref:Uncharacterized protein n=1 Tax=Elysia crispata TaxID=231223 RepID=A0AAE1E530_9GAST|nr:hypothetical protein RRG08_024971 [Elysia crispata]
MEGVSEIEEKEIECFHSDEIHANACCDYVSACLCEGKQPSPMWVFLCTVSKYEEEKIRVHAEVNAWMTQMSHRQRRLRGGYAVQERVRQVSYSSSSVQNKKTGLKLDLAVRKAELSILQV